jgi:hypothetical protein
LQFDLEMNPLTLFAYLVLVQFSLTAHAAKRPGAIGPILETNCEALLTPAYARSETFRARLKSKLLRMELTLAREMALMLETFNAGVEHRRLGSVPLHSSLSYLFETSTEEWIPRVAPDTRHALEAAYGRFDEIDILTVHKPNAALVGTARARVAKDPYFLWLKKRMRDSRTPEIAFFQSLDDSSPSQLTPDLAIVRIYRDLDPELSPALYDLAQALLTANRIIVTLRHDGVRFFSQRNVIFGTREAWDLAEDLPQAKKQLRRLQDDEITGYSSLFSRKSFDLAARLLASEPPMQPEFDASVLAAVKLRDRLQLPPSFDIHLMRRALQNVRRSSNYEEFLLLTFDPQDGNLAARKYRWLKQIIDYAEALQSETKFLSYFSGKVGTMGFGY